MQITYLLQLAFTKCISVKIIDLNVYIGSKELKAVQKNTEKTK